jgi:hypothetical protein
LGHRPWSPVAAAATAEQIVATTYWVAHALNELKKARNLVDLETD